MIYTDKAGHLVADTLQELHSFAKLLGLKVEWFQNQGRYPHYDLTTSRIRKKALALGAELISSREIVKLLKGKPK